MSSPVSRRIFLGTGTAVGAGSALWAPTAGADSHARTTRFGTSTATSSSSPLASSQGGEQQTSDVVIAASSRISALDPALAVDTETQRVTRQIFEPLIGFDPTTAALAPLLATDWEISANRRRYTFRLDTQAQFHDGQHLSASIVAANFQRWSKLNEIYDSAVLESYPQLAFPVVFGGFANEEDRCVYDSVETNGDSEITLVLKEPISYLLEALTQPEFAIAALNPRDHKTSESVSGHPRGTGPYQLENIDTFEPHNPAQAPETVRLQAFAEYQQSLEDAPQRVTVRSMPRSFDRLRELQRGTVDVYDYITVDNLRSLVQDGRVIQQRDPFSVVYLGINNEHPLLQDVRVREAVAVAVDKPSLVRDFFLEGSRAAEQFTPASLNVHAQTLENYSYNPDRARELLTASGYDGEPLRFYYPLLTTRNYLPQPEGIYAAISASLSAAGFNISPQPVRWDDGYLAALLQDGHRAFHLLGISGSYRSPHAFLGLMFSRYSQEFRYENADVVDLLNEARGESDAETRTELYQHIAEILHDDIPAIPLAFPISALGLGPRIAHYPLSPTLNERYERIRLTEQ